MSPTIAYNWLQMANTIEKSEDRNLNLNPLFFAPGILGG